MTYILYTKSFNSLLKALLLKELSDGQLISRDLFYKLNLHATHKALNPDTVSLNQIYLDYIQKFGRIDWLEQKDADFYKLKNTIELALRHHSPSKHQVIEQVMQETMNFGPTYFSYKLSEATKSLYNLVDQVDAELHLYAKQTPIFRNQFPHNVAVLECHPKNHILDLLASKVLAAFPDHTVVIRTPLQNVVKTSNETTFLDPETFALDPLKEQSFWKQLLPKISPLPTNPFYGQLMVN